MTRKNNTKPLVFIIFILLLSNLALIFFFVFNNKSHERNFEKNEKGGMYSTLQNDVGFSEAQLNKYLELRKDQLQNLRPYFEEVRKSKHDFYSLIPEDNTTDSLVEAKANYINEKQKLVDLKMFNYFKQVRSLCVDGQFAKFDSVFKKSVLNRMIGGGGRSGKRPK